MQTNEHVDLANWLTAVWDEEERLARLEKQLADDFFPDAVVDYQWVRFVRDTPGGMARSSSFSPGAPSPASVLARIAADRKILAAWLYLAEGTGPLSDELAGQLKAYGWAVQYIAEAHRDRPGFRSEWLVERQGVEQ